MIKDKDLALKLLMEKADNDFLHTYEEISEITEYSSRQLKRWMKPIREKKDMSSVLTHGNTGRQPVTTASSEEYSYLREFKKPYPRITIAQFRDIFIEDVISNPDRQDDVIRYGLKPRSTEWFRQLFIKEGWESPAVRPSRKTDGREAHPIREPMAREGELVQIDGTEFDWFQNGTTYTLHSSVDDATSEVLSGWFMPTECTTGYCYMMRLIIENYGKPEALYSDRHSIFRSVKNGTVSQFGMMMDDLGIKMIFALSSQAKGRVERYNQTEQLRLVNDITRFHITDVQQLNTWYNSFYRHYLNKKFSYLPRDPNVAFTPMPENFNYVKIFRGRMTRNLYNDMISFQKNYYSLIDENGEVLSLNNGTKVNVYLDVFTRELYAERYGKKYTCIKVGTRKRTPVEEADNEKEVAALLRSYRGQK